MSDPCPACALPPLPDDLPIAGPGDYCRRLFGDYYALSCERRGRQRVEAKLADLQETHDLAWRLLAERILMPLGREARDAPGLAGLAAMAEELIGDLAAERDAYCEAWRTCHAALEAIERYAEHGDECACVLIADAACDCGAGEAFVSAAAALALNPEADRE